MKTGRDDWENASAGETVRAWAALELDAGTSVAVIEQALRQADALDAWPTKKIVTADHLTYAETRQLIYAHCRRSWNGGRMSREGLAAALMLDLLANIAAAPASGALVNLKDQALALREVLTGVRDHV